METKFKKWLMLAITLLGIVCQSCDKEIDGGGPIYYYDIKIEAPGVFLIDGFETSMTLGYQCQFSIPSYSPVLIISANESDHPDFKSFIYTGQTEGKVYTIFDGLKGEEIKVKDIQESHTFSDGAILKKISDAQFVLENLPESHYFLVMNLSIDSRPDNDKSKKERVPGLVGICG